MTRFERIDIGAHHKGVFVHKGLDRVRVGAAYLSPGLAAWVLRAIGLPLMLAVAALFLVSILGAPFLGFQAYTALLAAGVVLLALWTSQLPQRLILWLLGMIVRRAAWSAVTFTPAHVIVRTGLFRRKLPRREGMRFELTQHKDGAMRATDGIGKSLYADAWDVILRYGTRRIPVAKIMGEAAAESFQLALMEQLQVRHAKPQAQAAPQRDNMFG